MRQSIEKRKYPATTGGRIEALPVDEDGFGHWFWAPAGDGNRHSMSGLLFLPRAQWWVAWWWAADDPLCTVDVVTPPRREDGTWVYDDLEIDLAMKESDKTVEVVDIDEFAVAVLEVPYTPHLIERAIEGMRDVERRMLQLLPPFDGGFDRLRSLSR